MNINPGHFPPNTQPKFISLSSPGSSTFPASRWKPLTMEKSSVSAGQAQTTGIPFPWISICKPTSSSFSSQNKFIKGQFLHAAFIPVLMVTNPTCAAGLTLQTLLVSHFRLHFLHFSSLWCLFEAQPKAQPHTGGCVCVHRQQWRNGSTSTDSHKERMLWLGTGWDATPPRMHLALFAAQISLQSSRRRCAV